MGVDDDNEMAKLSQRDTRHSILNRTWRIHVQAIDGPYRRVCCSHATQPTITFFLQMHENDCEFSQP